MRISVKHDRIEFLRPNETYPPPEIFHITGVKKFGRFEFHQQIVVKSEVEKKYTCRLNRGIYAVFAHVDTFLCLIPERVRLTPEAARELLKHRSLPAPRKLRASIAVVLSDLICQGATWSGATAMLGLGTASNGHTRKSTRTIQRGGSA